MRVDKLQLTEEGVAIVPAAGAADRDQTQEAYLRGVRDGQALLQEEMDTLLCHLSSQVEICRNSWEGAMREWISAAEEEMFRTACEIVQKVLSAEAVANPLLLYARVKKSLQQIVGSAQVRIVVPAKHVSWWRALEQDDIKVVADGALEPGQVKIEADMGSADLGIATQIAEIRASLLGDHLPLSANLQ